MTVALAAEVRAWLGKHWDPDRPLGEWWAILAESGWGFPHFPVEWFGRGLARADEAIVAEAFCEHGAYGPPRASPP